MEKFRLKVKPIIIIQIVFNSFHWFFDIGSQTCPNMSDLKDIRYVFTVRYVL